MTRPPYAGASSAMCDAWDAQNFDALNASKNALEPVLKKYVGQ